MAVNRVVTVRAENGASVPPPMEGWEKMLGMEWRFSGVSTGHTDGVKPPLFYHTYQLVEADDGQETPASTTGLPTIQDARKRADDRERRIRAWLSDGSAPLEYRKNRLMELLPRDLYMLASKIEIDGVCLKDRAAAPTSAMPPVAAGVHVWHDCKVHGHVNARDEFGNGCVSCDGGLGGCVVCGQWEGQLEDTCPGAKA